MRKLRDADARRCGQCGGWTLVGRICTTCSIRLQNECTQATNEELQERYYRQQRRLIEERREVLRQL